MASRSPRPPIPFGYSYDAIAGLPYPSPPPPVPAPGPSLLDDVESNRLDDFFHQMNSSTFDTDALFGGGKSVDPSLHINSAFGIIPPETLAPRSLETSWQHSSPAHDYGEVTSPVGGDDGRFLATPISQDTSTSEDVLVAASTLMRNGALRASESLDRTLNADVFPAAQLHVSRPNLVTNPSLLRRRNGSHYPENYVQYAKSSMTTSPQAAVGSTNWVGAFTNHYMWGGTADMAIGTPSDGRQNSGTRPIEIRWGSDASFLDHGYVAPRGQETEEELTQDLLQKVEYMVAPAPPSNPQPSTHVSTPPGSASHDTLSTRGTSTSSGSRSLHDPPLVEEEMNLVVALPPKKKRRRSAREDGGALDGTDHVDAPTPAKKVRTKAAPKTPRARKNTIQTSPDAWNIPDTPGEDGSNQAGRVPLTEEQRRANHLKSEQRRRAIIQESYDELCQLVPGVNGAGYSKRAVLIEAGNWLEGLLEGNEVLRATLASLQGR
ncbi:MAG: Cytochrome c oxidase assembly protein cox11, mitochondrial [Watsoniomyces obsoletus]|nr:MAG: Cytochrome c oxidase assembly protein cox11, mitochondrial [Watsoniomyces obsoletus]